MHIEIEVKFLHIDHDEARIKLQKAGAVCTQPMRLMRRSILDFPDGRLEKSHDGHVRVRDEGHKVAMAYKEYKIVTSAGIKEIETTVGDYDSAIALLKAAGLIVKSEQETKRESWQLGECQIELDEWPWIDPFLEIEGPSDKHLQQTAKLLGLDWKDAIRGSATAAYREDFAIPPEKSIGDIAYIAFDEPVPKWLSDLHRLDTSS